MGKSDRVGGFRVGPVSRRVRDVVTLSRLAAIVDNSPDAILAIDLDSTITDWNYGAERLYGHGAEEIIGRPVSCLVPPEAVHELDDIMETVQRGEVIGPYDTVRLCKDGSHVHVSLTASPVTDEQGAVIGISWIARDITERKRSEEALRASEAQLAALYEHNPAGVLLSELETGRFLRVNETFERVLGYTREEAVGHTMAELGMVASTEEREQVIRGLREGKIYTNREMTVRAKGGRPVVVLASAQLLEICGKRCIVNAVIDVTERKAAEDTLREADRRKDEFLAMLSHELRNPMAAISDAVHLMAVRGLGEPKLERARAAAERQVRHMARLLDDLLDVARVTRGTIVLRPQEVVLDDIVETALDTARTAIEAKGQVLFLSLPQEPLRLHADPARLAQVVANLLDNATKYTPAGGHIQLSAERAGDEAVLRVRDDGMGIPAGLLPQVFDLFTQGERSPGRSDGGLGIGLTMVRRLVELHGGRVEAHSDGPGKGSEFVVHLLLQGATPDVRGSGRATPSVEVGASSSAKRVLVVDDVADTADLLAELVEVEGHEARIARSGSAAIELAAAYHPDVVLLDLGMPGMDGYEVARRLREKQGGERTTIIAVTGYGQDKDRERTRAAGFDHHLVKPVDVDVLRRLLQEAPAMADR
ncbi:MAG TPA: PAS domain S-box protein [Polyangiaceae bacterium]|nr:PAS domain S-box protein [Polyangiaceae bacterium]